MFDLSFGEQEENLWLSVIQHAWITALNDRNYSSKTNHANQLYQREKDTAISFFTEKNGMLDWICERIEGLDSDHIRELFNRSLKDDKLKEAILSSYRKNFLNSKSKTDDELGYSLALSA